MLRIPNDHNRFLVSQAGRMFRILSDIAPCHRDQPIHPDLLNEILNLQQEALLDGINMIAVSEGEWEKP